MAAEFGIPISQKPQLTQFSILFCDYRVKPKTSNKFFSLTYSLHNHYLLFYKYEKYPIVWDIESFRNKYKKYEGMHSTYIKYKLIQTQGIRLFIGVHDMKEYPTGKQKRWLRKFLTFLMGD